MRRALKARCFLNLVAFLRGARTVLGVAETSATGSGRCCGDMWNESYRPEVGDLVTCSYEPTIGVVVQVGQDARKSWMVRAAFDGRQRLMYASELDLEFRP